MAVFTYGGIRLQWFSMKWLTQILVITLLPALALAKPMPAASLEEGLTQSPYVVVATFESIDSRGADFLRGTESQFIVTQVLKGKIPKGPLTLSYSFHDNTPCLPIKGWKISQETLPQKGSKWILILSNKDPKASTYRGSFGRLPYTKQNLNKVGKLLGEGC